MAGLELILISYTAVFAVGVLVIRDLLFAVYIWPPEFFGNSHKMF